MRAFVEGMIENGVSQGNAHAAGNDQDGGEGAAQDIDALRVIASGTRAGRPAGGRYGRSGAPSN